MNFQSSRNRQRQIKLYLISYFMIWLNKLNARTVSYGIFLEFSLNVYEISYFPIACPVTFLDDPGSVH